MGSKVDSPSIQKMILNTFLPWICFLHLAVIQFKETIKKNNNIVISVEYLTNNLSYLVIIISQSLVYKRYILFTTLS